jgi:cupin 2 domain-containing protein
MNRYFREKEMIEKLNIFDNIPLDKKNENFFEILQSKTVKIEKIVSNGQKSDENFWYDQEKNEFVIVLKGEAILQIIENEEIKSIKLREGDYLDIKAHVKHRVEYTSQNEPTMWLAVFY